MSATRLLTLIYHALDVALTLTRLLLHSRQPFLDFLWLFLAPESPILVNEDLREVKHDHLCICIAYVYTDAYS